MKKQQIDWTNPPTDIEEVSLGGFLHDETLESIVSDRLARTLRMTIDISEIRRGLGLPEDIRFILQFEGVRSVRAERYIIWPGEFVQPADASREEKHRLVNEYQAKFRYESMDWEHLESLVNAPEATGDIYDAELLQGNGVIAFHIFFNLDSPLLPNVFVQAEKMIIERSDGVVVDLSEMNRLAWEFTEL